MDKAQQIQLKALYQCLELSQPSFNLTKSLYGMTDLSTCPQLPYISFYDTHWYCL